MGDLGEMLQRMIRAATREELGPMEQRLERIMSRLDEIAGAGGGRGRLPEFVSAREAAKRLGVTTATVRGLVRGGHLGRYAVGNRLRIRVDELLNYMAQGETARTADGVVDLESHAREILQRKRG